MERAIQRQYENAVKSLRLASGQGVEAATVEKAGRHIRRIRDECPAERQFEAYRAAFNRLNELRAELVQAKQAAGKQRLEELQARA